MTILLAMGVVPNASAMPDLPTAIVLLANGFAWR